LTGIEPETKRRYRRYIVNDIDPFLGHLPIDAVTQFLDAEWVLWLAERGNGGKTIRNKHGFFSAAMGAAAPGAAASVDRPQPVRGHPVAAA
jgi:hypothetical protein